MVMADVNIGGSLQQILLPYPEFQLGAIIDPFEHNANNSEMLIKINQMVTVLNSFIGGEANTSISAMAIHMPAVDPIIASDLETFLRTLISSLRSVEKDKSGAHFVKSTPIRGIPGETIWEQLSFISEAITGVDAETGEPIVTEGDQEITLAGQLKKLLEDFALHKSGDDHDSRYYLKEEMDDKLELKLNKKDDDYEGTWQGWTVEKMRSFTGTGFGVIEVLSADPINPKEGRIWIVSGQGSGEEE
jgi:hypothetical protein